MITHGRHIITVYEHQSLKVGTSVDFEERHLLALQRYFGEKGTLVFQPYSQRG